MLLAYPHDGNDILPTLFAIAESRAKACREALTTKWPDYTQAPLYDAAEAEVIQMARILGCDQ